MVTFAESKHPVVRSTSPLSRGVLKSKGGGQGDGVPKESSAQLVSLCAKRFGAGQWSFLGPGSEKKRYSIGEDSPQGDWDKMAEKMMVTLAESGLPVFRATSPLSRGVLKSKGGGKLSIHFCADPGTIETVFRTIISVNQLSIHGAVSDVREDYSTCQTSKGDPYGQDNLTHCSRQQTY